MFKCKTCEALRSEINFLRNANKDLQDRLMACVQDISLRYETSKITNAPAPSFVDIAGKLESMEAVTEEEKKQKQEAQEQIKQLLGA